MTKFDENLIAPCGMNCGVCEGHLIYLKGIKRNGYGGCKGCRARDKQCAFLKGHCPQLAKGKLNFCYECKKFPCEQLLKLDKRYEKKGWDVSFSENNKRIKEIGLKKFIKEQEKKFICTKCGGTICVHLNACYNCGKKKVLS